MCDLVVVWRFSSVNNSLIRISLTVTEFANETVASRSSRKNSSPVGSAVAIAVDSAIGGDGGLSIFGGGICRGHKE